jgi:3-oxoacyl-[acyl-carrier-protein] synthase II
MTIYATGLGVISSLGNDRASVLDALNRSLRDGTSAADLAPAMADEARARYPAALAVPAQPFDIGEILGQRKGTRVLDRMAQLAVGACTLALRDGAVAPDGHEDEIGMVLGTQNGSLSQVARFLCETYTLDKPWMISPETFPNTVMNFAAGQCAIWHKLRAVNTTLSSGSLSGLCSLKYAMRMLEHGRASTMLAGGAEELSPETAWYYSAARGGTRFKCLAEGAGMLCLSQQAHADPARTAVRIAACEIAHSPSPERAQEIFLATLDRALGSARCASTDIDYVVCGLDAHGDSAERRSLQRLFAACTPTQVPMRQLVGECFSANTALQLVAACLLLEQAGPGHTALVTGLSEHGNLGCAVLRTAPAETEHA